ncbi:protein N-terminal glutamine amidohydrolase isoform 2-T2 [Polymixia lowei]
MHGNEVCPGYHSITPSRETCVYTSCYCEENVWKLCEFINAERQNLVGEVYAVFISNERRMVPLWKQRSGHGDEPVIWLYAAQAFRSDQGIKPAFWRKLRVIPANCFLKTFASDRSHMKDTGGAWRMPPPPYLCIQTTESLMNLDDFISMEPSVGWGRVFSLSEFITHFAGQG